jgi:hypothetical protein
VRCTTKVTAFFRISRSCDPARKVRLRVKKTCDLEFLAQPLDFLFLLRQGDDALASEGRSALADVGLKLAFLTSEHVWVDAKVFSGFVDALGLREVDGLGFVVLVVKCSGHVSLHCGAELVVHKILPTLWLYGAATLATGRIGVFALGVGCRVR